MKKITLLAALLLTCLAQAQITTGNISLSGSYSVSLEVSDTDVLITMIGDENRWMGLGFGVSSMTAGGDVVSFDSTGFNDRAFSGIGQSPQLDTQDWTLLSNDVSGGVRTVVATRDLSGSDGTDFTFDPNADSLDIVWANGVTGNFQNHGSSNRGSTTVAFSLGINGMETQAISLFPVPANDVLSVSLQNVMLDNTTIEIYSALGALVLSQAIDHKSSVLDVSNLAKGIYVVKVTASSGVLTTRFIKE